MCSSSWHLKHHTKINIMRILINFVYILLIKNLKNVVYVLMIFISIKFIKFKVVSFSCIFELYIIEI